METITLSKGDERLGTVDREGVRVYPKQDITGRPVTKGKGGVRGAGKGYFVVVPIGFRANITIVVQDSVSVDTVSTTKKPINLKGNHEPDDNPA